MEHKLQKQEKQEKQAERASKDDLSRYYHDARLCEANYSFAEAQRLYEKILQMDPNEQHARVRMLHCFLLDGQSHAAAVRAESIILEAPDKASSAGAYLVLARVHAGEGDYEAARRLFTRASELDNCMRDTALEQKLGLQGPSRKSPEMFWREGFDQAPTEWPVDGFHPIGGNSDSPFELSMPGDKDEEARRGYEDNGFFEAIESEMGATGMSISNFEEPDVSFRDIGGYRDVKENLRLQFYYPMRHEDLFRDYGKEAGGSVLLYGPHGCGKTMLAQAVANEVGRPLITIGAHQILEAGESAASRLRHFFEMARCQLPGVLFFDNAENLLDGADVALRGQFLSEMDRLEKEAEQLLVIFATSRPWLIDPVFRRSGRFRQSMLVDVPNKEERCEVIRVLARSLPLVEFDSVKVASRTEGFTGAELRTMFDIAGRKALIDALRNRGETSTLTTRSLLDAAVTIRPCSMTWFDTLRNHLDTSLPLRGGKDILAHLR